jgi:arsenite methyltransferase
MKMDENNTRQIVRETYGKVAQGGAGCGCGTYGIDADDFAKSLGYSDGELSVIPDEANLGLSCGNPTAIASLKPGETVLDLGSGAGFDCFLAGSKVGSDGKAIGVDMTPQMIEKARENARNNNVKNVEFRLGEIENLPVADNTVDVIISNCVINLSPDKSAVMNEAFRVLKPGGRIAFSDVVLKKELPAEVKNDIQAYTGCISGSILMDEYRRILKEAGFDEVIITSQETSGCGCGDSNDPIAESIRENIGVTYSLDEYVTSANIEARK